MNRLRRLARLDQLAKYVAPIVISIYTLKCMIASIVSTLYKKHATLVDPQDPFSTHRDRNPTGVKLYKLLRSMGCITRSGREPTGYGATLYFFNGCFYMIIQYLWRRGRAEAEFSGTSAFLRRPASELSRLAQTYESHLNCLLASNLEYQKLSLKNLCDCDEMIQGMLHLESNFLAGASSGRLGYKIAQQVKRHDSNEPLTKHSSCRQVVHGPKLIGSLLSDLDRQKHHLRYLAAQRSVCWPANRTLRWRRVIIGAWFYTMLSSMSLMWLCSTSIIAHLQYEAWQAIMGDPTEEFRQFGAADSIDVAVQHTTSYFMVLWYLNSTTNVLTSSLDQFKHFSHVAEKLKRFNKRLERLNETSPWEEENVALVDKLKFYCDSKAMEIYLSTILLANDMRRYFKQMNREIAVCSALVLASFPVVIIPMVPVSAVEKIHFNILTAFGIYTINIAMLPGAFLHDRYQKLAKQCWSLLARAESFSLCSPLDQSHRWVPRASMYLLTPHTLALWRRFVFDLNPTAAAYSSSLFGFMRVNYTTMIKLNFWLSSLLLFEMDRRLESFRLGRDS